MSFNTGLCISSINLSSGVLRFWVFNWILRKTSASFTEREATVSLNPIAKATMRFTLKVTLPICFDKIENKHPCHFIISINVSSLLKYELFNLFHLWPFFYAWELQNISLQVIAPRVRVALSFSILVFSTGENISCKCLICSLKWNYRFFELDDQSEAINFITTRKDQLKVCDKFLIKSCYSGAQLKKR